MSGRWVSRYSGTESIISYRRGGGEPMASTRGGRVLKRDLEKQVFDLRNLLEISKSLSSTLDYNILNDSILYTCLGALTVVKAAFFSKKSIDSNDFTLHRSFLGFDIDHKHSYSIPERCPLIEYLNLHTVCHDPERLYQLLSPSPEIAVLASIEPHIVVPLKAKGAINGILVLGEKIGGGSFDDRDRDYLMNIAGLAAIAIHNAYLFELSTTDMMTGLKLKHYFLNNIQERFRTLALEKQILSLVMLDIDHFKRVNDSFGHLAGDETLKGVAGIVQEAVRLVDVAARYGGEEFIVLLPGVGRSKAQEIAERIRKRVEKATFVSGNHLVKVTVSFGVAEYNPTSDTTPLVMIERVDHALYASKQNGRNRVTMAD
jgi:two-component system, cell cycle response regulator